MPSILYHRRESRYSILQQPNGPLLKKKSRTADQQSERKRTMGGKAKFKKHTAADLERRQKQVNKGGGKAGAATRGVAKLNFTCDICMKLTLLRLPCLTERVARHQVVRAALHQQAPEELVRPRLHDRQGRGPARLPAGPHGQRLAPQEEISDSAAALVDG
ncbi:hypothetical protein ON010_g18325 [Phytophthora cinnamomi]|nr:hypothetical protein ON010_g18325 [Phytophthora cinnamomi]